MKLTSILKEITVKPNKIAGLAKHISSNLEFKTQLVNAVYDAVNFTPDSGWLEIKQEIIDGDVEIDEKEGYLILIGYEDGIMISLDPFTSDITNEEGFDADTSGSFILNKIEFYYGLV